MKYTYAYKTPDGVRHEGSMNASSREEVFSALRERGIRAIKVVAADGSRANGEIRGIRRRVVVAIVALAAIGVGAVAYFSGMRTAAVAAANPASASPRHQIYGDPAVMETMERGDFHGCLPSEGDRILAVFAQPGKLMCARGADPRRLDRQTADAFAEYAKDGLAPEMDLAVSVDEPREIRELKQIVNGMREEMRTYLANGNGTARSFYRRLNERTLSELRIYERTRRELEKEQSPEVWDEKNEALRRLGLRTIPNPKDEHTGIQ